MTDIRPLSPNEEILPPKARVRELTEEDGFRELDPNEEVLAEQPPVAQFGRGANIGIAETLGAPVDLANFVLGFVGLDSEEPVGGSRQIRRGMAALGLAPPVGEDDPDTFLGSVGRVTGAATGFLLPVGGAARAGRQATSTAGRIVQDIAQTAVQSPGKFAAIEAVSGASAGAGGFAARQLFPESEAASFIGEFVGGFTPATVFGAAKVLPSVLGIRLARRIVRPFTTSGARRRAERRVQESTRQPGATTEGEVIEEANLTPAQRTGDEGLLSLERSVIESSEELKGQADEQIARATQAIRQNIGDLGEGVPPQATAQTIEEARQYVVDLVEARVRIAARRADERIAELGPGSTREDANLIAREELQKALDDARAQERELFEAVPDDIQASTTETIETFKQVLKDTPRAQRDDIPAIAQRMLRRRTVAELTEIESSLTPEEREIFGPLIDDAKRFNNEPDKEIIGRGQIRDEESIREMQGLRSRLLEEARKARGAGEFNKARISNILADAVLRDIDATEGGDLLAAARDFSRFLNERFTRGTVGRILATDAKGAPRTPESLTLETTVGKGGPKARVETQAILEAADTPALRGAIEDFVLNDFERRAIRNGKIDQAAARTFMTRNADALEEFPDLRARLENAIEASDAASIADVRAEGLAKRLNDPKVSRSAIFIKEPVDQAMARIAKSPNPKATMKEIARLAKRDTTGDAVNGLKTAFGDLLLSRASTRSVTTEGDFVISGRTLKKLLSEGPLRDMAEALLNKGERRRLEIIADTAEKVEKALAAKAKPEGIIADQPSALFASMARIAGAQIGRRVAVETGGGTVQTPGIVSGAFRRALEKRVQDPARRLLIDAMKDKALFDSLLIEPATVAQNRRVERQLNAWLATIGQEES